MDIITPKGWRKGQTLYNFLRWLRTKKNFSAPLHYDKMADPFYIEDKELDKLYDEFIMQHI